MLRRFLLALLVMGAGSASGSDITLLNCGDFSGSPEGIFLSPVAATTTSGINYWVTRQGGAINTIVRSGVEWQITSFWGPTNSSVTRAVIAIRKNRGSWSTFILDGTRGTPNITPTDIGDAHYTIATDCDPDGYIHMIWSNHNDTLNYRKSTLPIETFAGAFAAAAPITGLDSVTYPFLFRDPGDNFLYLWIGQGIGSGNRDWHERPVNRRGERQYLPVHDAAGVHERLGRSRHGLYVRFGYLAG
jgi:hypothetical protein